MEDTPPVAVMSVGERMDMGNMDDEEVCSVVVVVLGSCSGL